MENIKAKDATPEQIAQIHKNLAQRKENRKIEIEINEAIQLASRKGRTSPHPTKTPVKKANHWGLKFAKAIIASFVGLVSLIWYFIKNLSANGWRFICVMIMILYIWASIT